MNRSTWAQNRITDQLQNKSTKQKLDKLYYFFQILLLRNYFSGEKWYKIAKEHLKRFVNFFAKANLNLPNVTRFGDKKLKLYGKMYEALSSKKEKGETYIK